MNTKMKKINELLKECFACINASSEEFHDEFKNLATKEIEKILGDSFLDEISNILVAFGNTEVTVQNVDIMSIEYKSYESLAAVLNIHTTQEVDVYGNGELTSHESVVKLVLGKKVNEKYLENAGIIGTEELDSFMLLNF